MDRLLIIQQFLWDLGMPPKYLGAHYLAFSVLLAMEDRIRLTMVTKWLYPEVAERYYTTWKAVERDIRTATRICWEQGGARRLEALAGHPLDRPPSPTGMVQLLTRYLLDQPERFWHGAPLRAESAVSRPDLLKGGQLILPGFAAARPESSK